MTQILKSGQHPLNPTQVSAHARTVISTLQHAGFKAFIVGGGVRDLLLNIKPKDFDVATNARPEEIRQIFRNSRLIGKRFRIAHIYFGRDIIEVSTFRADHTEATHEDQAETREDGIITRDNVFGTFEQDAKRRDFTVNSLYYDPINNELWDHCSSLEDIKNKKIRIIGDPEARFQEDPIRLLRAIRFANKLQFSIEAETKNAFPKKMELLKFIPSGRRFDEYTKLFLYGQAEANFNSLLEFDAIDYLFPGTAESIHHDPSLKILIQHALQNTDSRIKEGKSVNPSFLIAAFLWKLFVDRKNILLKKNDIHEIAAINQAISEVMFEQIQHTSMPKRLSQGIAEIWSMQYALERRRPRQILRIIHNAKFRAAYDFLIMREVAEDLPNDLCNWWTTIQTLPHEKQKEMIAKLPSPKHKKN
jgi:poly(A) polymerase